LPTSPMLKKLSTIVGVTVILFLLDWFYVTYVTAHGFEIKTQQFALGGMQLSIPLQWLPVIGIILVSLVGWYEVSYRIFPKRGVLETDPLADLRLLRVIIFSVALFIFILYIPSLIGSNWFWARLSDTGKSISQVRAFGLSLLSTDESAMSLNPLWQYSLTQVLAAAALVFLTWAFARRPKRPRKVR
jgi:hypothetical protein